MGWEGTSDFSSETTHPGYGLTGPMGRMGPHAPRGHRRLTGLRVPLWKVHCDHTSAPRGVLQRLALLPVYEVGLALGPRLAAAMVTLTP